MSVAAIRHFLDLIDIPPRELSGIIEASRAMKKRTHVSFDVAKDRNNV